MIECVDAVTIEEAREISESLDTDQDRAEDARPRGASRARKLATCGRFFVLRRLKRSGFLVFSKHYLHLLEKVDAITICFNFC